MGASVSNYFFALYRDWELVKGKDDNSAENFSGSRSYFIEAHTVLVPDRPTEFQTSVCLS